MDTKTSPLSPKCQCRSSFVVVNMLLFVLVNPLSATPLFSPSSLARASQRPPKCVHSIFSCHPGLVKLSAMASPTLRHGSFRHGAQRVENNLRVVWRGSQRVNLSVCIYVCICVIVKSGGIVGGGGIIKQFLLKFFVCCVLVL